MLSGKGIPASGTDARVDPKDSSTPSSGRTPDTIGPTDEELVARVRTGEKGAFEALMARYQALVHLVAYRQLGREDQVDDIAQEAFHKAWLRIHDLDDPSRFKAWLVKITANLALDQLRSRKHQGVSLDDTSAFIAAESSAAAGSQGRSELRAAGEEALHSEMRMQIVEAIYSLPEEYQIPAAMRLLEELPYKEISRRMGLREETLRKRIHRANLILRRKLRALWPEQEDV